MENRKETLESDLGQCCIAVHESPHSFFHSDFKTWENYDNTHVELYASKAAFESAEEMLGNRIVSPLGNSDDPTFDEDGNAEYRALYSDQADDATIEAAIEELCVEARQQGYTSASIMYQHVDSEEVRELAEALA